MKYLGTTTTLVLLAATVIACSGGGIDSTFEEPTPETEAHPDPSEESEAGTGESIDNTDRVSQEGKEAVGKDGWDTADKEQWTKDKEETSKSEGSVLERTLTLVEGSRGEIDLVNHPGRGDQTVLVTPTEFVDGVTPLVVSLHGFGGDSAYQSIYVPLHERVNSDGFGLLLPNGIQDSEGNRFWNPTDGCCDSGKSGEDDVAYLTELVAEARKSKEFGAVYFFGYSNGGFMSHHIACKGLPGLRAVASLAGTSYVDDSSCEGTPAVSVLHIHGTEDSVIFYEGDASEPDPAGDGERAFYLGAEEMAERWSRKAGCEWPDDPQPYATTDLDRYVTGPETRMYRAGCGEGISVELWSGVGSGHAPGYDDDFVDALLGWLLSQG